MKNHDIRDAAQALIRLFAEPDQDRARLRDGILAATRPLLDRADLPTVGAKRQGNFVSNSKFLYYDGQLELTLNQMPRGKQFPVHDHGTCEALVIYSGALQHTVYERTDDGAVEGHATLKIVEDGILRPGDITVMVPPLEIHGFAALTDDTFVLTVLEGQYRQDRHFYQPDAHTYVLAAPPPVRGDVAPSSGGRE